MPASETLAARLPNGRCGRYSRPNKRKTRIFVAIFELIGIPPRISKALQNGEGDFWVAGSAGGSMEKRRLYTDGEKELLRFLAWLGISSANPTFGSDDGLADRLLVVRVARRLISLKMRISHFPKVDHRQNIEPTDKEKPLA